MLINIKLFEYIILDEKSQFCKLDIKILDFVYNFNKQSFDSINIIKIVKYLLYKNVFEVEIFIKLIKITRETRDLA